MIELTFKTLEWKSGALHLLDQRALPAGITTVMCTSSDDVAVAIRNMTVRGAPAIGVAAAYGMVLSLKPSVGDFDTAKTHLRDAATLLKRARPTAVNLAWAVDRMMAIVANAGNDFGSLRKRLEEEAVSIHEDDAAMCMRIGAHGAGLLEDGMTVLTHCNAGALATAGIGTALGVIYTAQAQGKSINVIADETRPVLQGARLTAWELMRQGIDVTLITDNTAASMFAAGRIDAVIVGADRIARNGDVANKIGTYAVAVLAKHHGVPFYVAAPQSTFDTSIATGAEIPIEERSATEVTEIGTAQLAPEHANVFSPAFDVTPNELITAIITDTGVIEGKR